MEKKQIIVTADEAKLVGQLMAGEVGQRVLNLLHRTFADQLSYVQGDTHHTTFREGQRSVVQFLTNAVKAAKAEDGR
jgi:hypothetical protein